MLISVPASHEVVEVLNRPSITDGVQPILLLPLALYARDDRVFSSQKFQCMPAYFMRGVNEVMHGDASNYYDPMLTSVPN